MDRKEHWDRVYNTKAPSEVSWYQDSPDVSVKLIQAAGVDHAAPIIDVGVGASKLIEHLLAERFANITVLDVSPAAIDTLKQRVGAEAEKVAWHIGDVTTFVPECGFQLWHDRAVFHFLTEKEDRARYAKILENAVVPGGHAIIATFAADGPLRCSGLDVVRYNEHTLRQEIGSLFDLVEMVNETHITPSGAEQKFTYFRFRRQL